MKTNKFNSIVILFIGTVLFTACSDYLLETPKAELGIYVLNEEGQLVEPDEIRARDTETFQKISFYF